MPRNPPAEDRDLYNHDGYDDEDDDERQSWRAKNSERLRWEMFLRSFGPDGDFEYLGQEPLDAEEEAAFAHREMLRCILVHHEKDGSADYESMSFEEKAFAHLFEELFLVIDDYDLFDLDIDYWRYNLKIDQPHFPELIARIDEHLGRSDWREICYFQKAQDNLMKLFCTNWEVLREDAFKSRAKDPDFKYEPWMDRPKTSSSKGN
jgi:hypothetical protein